MAPRTAGETDFGTAVAEAYATKGAAVELGTGVLERVVVPGANVRIPLGMMNRHGLVAGATGTGKTRTLQGIAEQLSAAGVAVFAADVKGDLSGMAVPGSKDGPAKKRASELGIPYSPTGFPTAGRPGGRTPSATSRIPRAGASCSARSSGALFGLLKKAF